MGFKINWAVIIPTAAFCLTLWLLQSALSTLYDAVEASCGEFSCGEKIAVAYQFLSLSTLVSAGAVAWAAYRYNTSLYKGKGGQ